MTETALPEQVDRHWRCDCGGGHFMSLAWWPGDLRRDMEIEGYLNVEGDLSTTWRARIAEAWRLLRGGCSATRVGVVIDPVKAREIASSLTEFADAATSGTTTPVTSSSPRYP